MASGLPDYSIGVDIILQSIAEITSRPKYGAAQLASISAQLSPGERKSLVTVAGKGVIYGGVLFVEDTNYQGGGLPILAVEGVEISNAELVVMNTWKLTQEKCHAFYLLRYDAVNFRYTTAITSGITFETEFEILYQETDLGTPIVKCRVYYALV